MACYLGLEYTGALDHKIIRGSFQLPIPKCLCSLLADGSQSPANCGTLLWGHMLGRGLVTPVTTPAAASFRMRWPAG